MCLFTNRSSCSACIMVLYLWTPLCPILSSQPRIGNNLWLARNGFSARHRYRWDTSHSYNVMKWVKNCRNRGIMVFTHLDMGRALHEWIFCIFHNGWMDCRGAFHVVLCLRILLCNRQNIAAYKAYWLMGFPIINHGGSCSPFFVLKHHGHK